MPEISADNGVARLLGHAPRRIAVAGVSGAGKSTLARRIAARLELPYCEIDSLFHGPGWVPREEFLDDVAALVAQNAFVTEWQYREARPLICARAEVLVWLDVPTHVAMRQVTARTVRRRLRREVLWNGNVEPPLRTFLSDRDHIVRWAWRTRRKYRDLHERVAETWPDVVLVRLRSHAEAEAWLARLGTTTA